jgi:4-alpha-glucanotransferase
MAPLISLALAIHNHQPVGNFGWVISEVFDHAYEPMVAALERHGHVKLSLHYSGPLLEWLREERPEFIDRLSALVAREQVEIIGGGYYEPVLASLPERDRIGQATRMSQELEAIFGVRPIGAWLAERVWEPDLPTSLVAAGYDWTILDDAHFRSAAIPEEDLWGPFTTEDQGQLLRVFGTEQGLRYRIPFRTVEEVIDYLRTHATEDGDRVGMMGDDGEKFGAWPTTWEHCWGERRWVERFFQALEANGDWLTTTTPSAWLADHAPIGRVYLPTGSYAEMGEWALPADESLAFTKALHHAQDAHLPEARWLRGAFWRNFQVRYREINDMHKQMLRASAAVDAMTGGEDRIRALDHLYQGQSNDTYWHGLFGGVYISHMRLATYEHLIAAEDLAETKAGRLHATERLDLDLDGHDEVRLAGPGQVVSIDLVEGAGIGGWDIRAVRHNVCAVLRRRPEAYHQKLRDHEATAGTGATLATDGAPAASDGAGPTSIHEIFLVKEPGLAAMLHYDPYERRSGLVRFLAPGTDIDAWANADAVELGDAVEGAYEIDELELDRLVVRRNATVATGSGGAAATVRVVKTFSLGGDRRAPTLTETVEIANTSDVRVEAILGLEWSVTMLGGGGNPAAWLEVEGERTSHDARRLASGQTSLAQGNEFIGIAIATEVAPAADIWCAPLETISNSEAGFERVYQGEGLLLAWPLSLAGGASRSVTVRHAVSTARDRAVEERAEARDPANGRAETKGPATPR